MCPVAEGAANFGRRAPCSSPIGSVFREFTPANTITARKITPTTIE